MKKIVKILSIALIMSLLLAFSAFAEEEFTLLPEGNNVSIDAQTIDPRGMLIATRIIGLTNNTDGTMTIDAQLLAHVSLDYALIRITLEEYDTETEDWRILSSENKIFKAADYDESFMSSPGTIYDVEGLTVGNYYRLKASYRAEKGGTYENATAQTEGVKLTKVK